jgi:glycosyltransferase involved in cell wall biosynthesis
MKRSHQSYTLIDVEATRAIPEVRLSGDAAGIAVLVRRKGRPVHFWMEAFSKHTVFTSQYLIIKGICEKSGIQIIKAAIREELTPRVRINRLPSVTVAVCTKDRTALLARCLRSLQRIDATVFGIDVPLEILVVDNAPSTLSTEVLVSTFPGVRYFLEPRPGLDFARNRAMQEARGDLLAYIDDDVVVDREWLRGLMEAWIAHPDAAGFTGQVLPLELATKAQIIFEERGGFRRGFDAIRYGQVLDGHRTYPCNAGIFGTGANMAFQKCILKKLDGFDEALDTGPPLPAAGDHDIFYRLIRGGYSIVYKPEFLAFHEHRREVKRLLRQYWSWGLGVTTFIDKCLQTDPSMRPKVRYLIRTWFSERFREFAGSLLGQAPAPFYMVVAEIIGGIAGLMGGYKRSVRRVEQIRRQFPSKLKAESLKLKGEIRGQAPTRNPDRPGSVPANPERVTRGPFPTFHFRPWEILHLDLSQRVGGLPRGETGGTLAVFWWRNIPLGQDWIPASQLPMNMSDVRECALTAIEPALRSRLLETSWESSSSGSSLRVCQMNLKTLATLERPLQRLEENLSLETKGTPCPTVSVVICTRDRPEQLKRCLASLQHLSKRPSEIIVVDNVPRSDATRRAVKGFPDIRYIREPKAGLDVARNRGITNTSGKIVAFTDDDATVHPDWIARICEGFKDPDVMAVTGLVLPAELETEAQYLFETYWGFGRGYLPKIFGKRFFEKAKSHGVPVWEIGAGANMAFRREIFNQVGLFDERLDVGAAGCSGDSEMWYRLLAQGWTCLYDPTAVVYHCHRRDMEGFYRQIRSYMRGHVAALLIQFERYRHWGNLRRILISLPSYHAGLVGRGIRNGFFGRERTLHAEVLGFLSGIKYYILNKGRSSSSTTN